MEWIQIPGSDAYLCRRNVKDVEFSVALNDDGEAAESNGIRNALQAKSDIIPAIYEGGVKTWECSLDLVLYLSQLWKQGPQNLRGKRVLEVSWLQLRAHFCSLGADHHCLQFIVYKIVNPLSCICRIMFAPYLFNQSLQNEDVLTLVSIPNVLANVMGDKECSFGGSERKYSEIKVCPARLSDLRIPVHFWSGDWSSLPDVTPAASIDILLGSELIYDPSSYVKIFAILRHALAPGGVCYLANKAYYFGCGGSTDAFRKFILNQSDGLFTCEVVVRNAFNSITREIMKIQKLQ